MSRERLQGVFGQWEYDPDMPGVDDDGFHFVYRGAMRLVRSHKRMRQLRRRGEAVIDTGERTRTGKRTYAWFVEPQVGAERVTA